jgi:hypothetical protein
VIQRFVILQILRELKDLKTEHHLLKLEFASARLQHTAHVKHLERDIQTLNREKVRCFNLPCA